MEEPVLMVLINTPAAVRQDLAEIIVRSPLIIAHQKIASVTPATIVWMIPLVSAIVNPTSTVVLVCIFKHMSLQMRLWYILDMPQLTLYSIIQ